MNGFPTFLVLVKAEMISLEKQLWSIKRKLTRNVFNSRFTFGWPLTQETVTDRIFPGRISWNNTIIIMVPGHWSSCRIGSFGRLFLRAVCGFYSQKLTRVEHARVECSYSSCVANPRRSFLKQPSIRMTTSYKHCPAPHIMPQSGQPPDPPLSF